MIELGTLIQKPLLDVNSSCILGRVTDVYFDEYCKKAVYFCIADGRGNYSLLPFEEVQSFSDALVVADGVGFLSVHDVDITVLQAGLLGMPIYTYGGLNKGSVRNALITSTGKVAKFRADEEEFAPTAILKIGDVILLKNNSTTKPRTAPKQRKIPRPKTDYPVQILDVQGLAENNNQLGQVDRAVQTVQTNGVMQSKSNLDKLENIKQLKTIDQPVSITATQKETKPAVALGTDNREPVLSGYAFEMLLDGSSAYSYDEDTHTPTRVICDYAFLLGRTLGADLCTYTGELIATGGSIVSDQIVEKARRAGKLVELTLNSVKPSAKT